MPTNQKVNSPNNTVAPNLILYQLFLFTKITFWTIYKVILIILELAKFVVCLFSLGYLWNLVADYHKHFWVSNVS